MFGENWDEDEVGPSSPPKQLVRGKTFKGRGRGFLTEQENEVPKSYAESSQGRSNCSEKWSDSESDESGSGNDSGNQNASRESRDHSLRDTSGKGSNSNNKKFGKCSTRESNGFICFDEAGYGDSPRNGNNSKSNASKYSDERESNAFKSLDEARYGDSPRNGNSRKSYASKYSDERESDGFKSYDEARYVDSPRNGNSRKSYASKYSDERESDGFKSFDEARYVDSPRNGNSRKSYASKYSDERESDGFKSYDEARYVDSPRNGNSRKSYASKYSDERESNGFKSFDEARYGDSPRNWNSRKSNASKYSDDEAERYEDSPEDISNSEQNDMPVRRRQGRNENGWNKENEWKNDRRERQLRQQPQQPPREHYIPNPDPENVEDLFSQNIASGINFDRYDDIQVTVTGDNIPPKIEHFEEAEICGLVMENIRRSSYVKPTPVQKHALPIIMSGRDMMACAQTGSGKTAAFLIPTINCMLESGDVPASELRSATPQLLIVTPTRELALQIYVEAKKLTYGSRLITEICYGGTDVRHQLNRVQRGCNILIATCGRLIDFLNRGAVMLSRLRHLIIDEADKMLDRGFFDDIETIIKHDTTNKDDRPQNLLFSATFPEEVQSLARMFLRDYVFIAVGIIGAACQDVEQRFYLVYKSEKKGRLINLLQHELARAKTLVFVQHKRIADIIAAKLSEIGFPATSMHGDREQKQREEALRDFRGGKANILVATAVAARGLDIRGISYVINYDLPQTVDEYVHRIGRTGRVGNRGLAISFYDPDTDSSLVPGISRILVQAHQNIPPFF